MQRYEIDFGATAEPIRLTAYPGVSEGWYVLLRSTFGESVRTTIHGPMKNEEEARYVAPQLEHEEIVLMETVVRNFLAGWYK